MAEPGNSSSIGGSSNMITQSTSSSSGSSSMHNTVNPPHDTSMDPMFDDEEHEQEEHPEQEDDQTLERRKKLFTKELRCMMYGFGDDQNPYTETVDVLEELVVEYISEMTKQSMETGRQGKLSVEDIIYLIRRDPKKYSRSKELLMMNEELRKARKAFDEVKYANIK